MRTLTPAVVFSLFLVASAQALGNTDPIAEEKLRLQQQKELLEAQKALLDAQKALIDVQYPKFTGGKVGTLTFGTSVDVFHAMANAQRALRALGTRICSDATLIAAKAIVFVADEDLKAATTYRMANRQLGELVKAYNALDGDEAMPQTRSSPVAGIAPAYAAATALSSVADLTKLFRTDLKVSAEDVQVSDNDLLNAISACQGFAAKVKSSQTFMAVKTLDEGQSAFWASYKKAQDLRAKSEAKGPVEIAELSVIDKTKIAGASKEDKATFVKLTADTARRAALIAIHDKIETLVNGANEAKYPNLLWILRGEEAIKQFDAAKADEGVLLSASIIAKGGFSVVSQSIWRSDKLYSRGGVAVSYRVLDPKSHKVLSTGFVVEESDVQEVKFK